MGSASFVPSFFIGGSPFRAKRQTPETNKPNGCRENCGKEMKTVTVPQKLQKAAETEAVYKNLRISAGSKWINIS